MSDERREWKVRCGPRTNREWVLDHAPPAPERGEQGVILVERAARDSAEAKAEQAWFDYQLVKGERDMAVAAAVMDVRAQRDRLATALREIVTASKRGTPGSSLAGIARRALSVLDRETPDALSESNTSTEGER